MKAFAKKIANLIRSQREWYQENAEFGRELGYPECCIKQFGKDSPEVLAIKGANIWDKKRYEAGCLDGKFSGFIPCKKHAKEILRGRLRLAELIKDRNPLFPPFPLMAKQYYDESE